jgi:hypothetical protein
VFGARRRIDVCPLLSHSTVAILRVSNVKQSNLGLSLNDGRTSKIKYSKSLKNELGYSSLG